MSSNKSLFSHLSYTNKLPSVILANGSLVEVHAIGQTNPLPTLSLYSLFFVPNCPFNQRC